MRIYQAIIVAGLLIGVSTGGVFAWMYRYDVAHPFNLMMFQRYDRWTGRVELCSTMFDQDTYCGPALKRRADEAVQVRYTSANIVFRTLGYSQEQIDHWPQSVLEQARNIVGNGGGNSDVAKFLQEAHVSASDPKNRPTADEFFGPQLSK